MDTFTKAASTYGMSAILLLSLWLAMRLPHPPAIKRWFRAQFYGALVLEMVEHIAGWDSDLYTFIYIPYTLIMLMATFGVVIEAYREPS